MVIEKIQLALVRGTARNLAFFMSVLAVCALSSWAGVSFDISAGLPIGDDAKIFLNVTNEYYAPPPEVATVIVSRCPHPEDDYPTVLLLAHAAGRPPGEILDLRLRGRSWADIMFTLRVSPSVLFVGLDHDPGPPYGRAWGYWRQHPQGRLVIEDRDFVELAKLRVTAGYYHVSPYTVAAERRRGGNIEKVAADRHRARHERAERREDRRERIDQASDRDDHKDHGPKNHGGRPGGPKH